MPYTLGFIGAGNMAEAIAAAAIRADVLRADQMIAADPNPDRRAVFEKRGIATTDDNVQVMAAGEQLLLAVKPQMMGAVAAELGSHLRDEQIVISIMAGITTEKLAKAVGKAARVVRVMPNTPVMVGWGMAGIALGREAKRGDDDLAFRLFSAAGKAIRVDEAKLDAVTAVSGSGPAYLFYLAEAMEQAAMEMGLEEHGPTLVAQTLVGASHLLDQSDDTASELRRKVTSPGGTTEAAINRLDHAKVHDAIVQALRAAQARSYELGA